MTNQFQQADNSADAFVLYQKAVTVFKAWPTDENREIAFEKHRDWQNLFLGRDQAILDGRRRAAQ